MLNQETVDTLVSLADESPDAEICGFILGDESVWRIANVSSDPSHNFWMDPHEQLLFLKEARSAGDRVLGVFHSHPGGNTGLSDADVNGWHPQLPYRYFLVSGRSVIEWTRGDRGDISRSWSGTGTIRSAKDMAASRSGS